MLFNGTNTDPKSKEIYQAWLKKHAGTDRVSGSPAADMRAALVDYFRDEAAIMIATEAAAEGINLQFCNLVVNYDLPWNPQRIEQRIGRCHRYGQKFDVVVVNFLNKSNAADQRVYELLDEKFRLFNGVFGASDEVLGAVESGVDFEKRIAAIYQKCRTPSRSNSSSTSSSRSSTPKSPRPAGRPRKAARQLRSGSRRKGPHPEYRPARPFQRTALASDPVSLGRLRPFRRRPVQFLPHPQSLPRRDDPSRPVSAWQERRRREHLPRRPSAGPAGLGPGNGPGPPPAEVVFDYSGGSKNIAALAPLLAKADGSPVRGSAFNRWRAKTR